MIFDRSPQMFAVEVGVDFGREDAFVAQHLLHLTDAGAPFEQVRGERMPEAVRTDLLFDAGAGRRLPNDGEDHDAR